MSDAPLTPYAGNPTTDPPEDVIEVRLFPAETFPDLPHASPGCACGFNDADEEYVDPICQALRAS